MTSTGMIFPPGTGKTVYCRGLDVQFKVTDEQALSGSFFELVVWPGFSVGAHRHTHLEELFYVVEGELTLRVDEQLLTSGPGTFMHVPPGSLHDFTNYGDRPARVVFFVSPPGHERYFEALGGILAQAGPPDTEAIAALRRKFDTEQVGPLVPGSERETFPD